MAGIIEVERQGTFGVAGSLPRGGPCFLKIAAPLAVDRGGTKDSRGYATGASCTIGEMLGLAVRVPDWDVSPKPVPDWPKGSRRDRVNVLAPSGDIFLFSMSTCYAEGFVQRKLAAWLTNKTRVRGVTPIPAPIDLLILAAQKYPVIPELECGPEDIHKPSDHHRVLGYAHKTYSEFVPAGVWTLDRLPEWAQTAFLRVVLGRGAYWGRGSTLPRKRAKVIVMKRRTWRDKTAERIAA